MYIVLEVWFEDEFRPVTDEHNSTLLFDTFEEAKEFEENRLKIVAKETTEKNIPILIQSNGYHIAKIIE